VLTADLVRTRVKGSELSITEIGAKQRGRALELARAYLELAEAHVGSTRAEVEAAFELVETKGPERKLALGLQKLVEDRLQFETGSEEDPRALRSAVFLQAAAARKGLEDGVRFERAEILSQVAEARGLSPDLLERGLYADLRNAQLVKGFDATSPEALVDGYDLAQKQAVLLRAVDVTADVRCRDPYAYRALFRRLKFFRLLHRIEPRVDGGYRIVIDGPFNLFSASTKYGLELALALPALLACDEHVIRANLRWGKERKPMTFELSGKSRAFESAEPVRLPDEVEAFLARFSALDTPFRASPSSDILELAGAGLCVPDVRFIHEETGEVAYLEVMGYWSRDAVWKRVELVQAGLSERVIFAVSSRLRVSEEVLGDEAPSELYVYKGTIQPKEILARLSRGSG
jgi:predicted nuclease of restriction endonuclease-like RecB superfamily